MRRLHDFEYAEPSSLGQAAELLGRVGRQAMPIAGGTDLMPSMRQGLFAPKVVVSLKAIDELRDVAWDDRNGLSIGALATLRSLESDPHIRRRFPVVAQAASMVASPTIRRTATVGGNLSLDTRCYYYNQYDDWRSCTTPCLKMGGEFCKASPGGKARKCFAAFSADLAPVLVALDASITLLSVRGERTLALRDFYTGDGARPNGKEEGEIITRVTVPKEKAAYRGAYLKHRLRGSIDYPTAAVTLALRPTPDPAVFEDVRLVISAVVTQPLVVKGVAELLDGKPLTEALIDEAASLAKKAAIPVANTEGERRHRKQLVFEFTRKAFADILEGAVK